MSKQREALEIALDALEDYQTNGAPFFRCDSAVAAIREALAEPGQKLDSALKALQNEMRQTISKLDPKEMVWIHQPPGMPPILCKEPVVGAVPVCATTSTRKPIGTVTGWYGGHPIIEPVGGWIPAVGTVLYSAPPARKPLSYMEACTFIALNIEGGAESLEMQSQLVDLIRAVERAHGIGEV